MRRRVIRWLGAACCAAAAICGRARCDEPMEMENVLTRPDADSGPTQVFVKVYVLDIDDINGAAQHAGGAGFVAQRPLLFDRSSSTASRLLLSRMRQT